MVDAFAMKAATYRATGAAFAAREQSNTTGLGNVG